MACVDLPLGKSQWPISMHCFQNKSADRASMKRIMKQPPQCMSFTLTFPRLGKAFNYCEMIGSHARWWNDLALSGDFIPFHRVGNNARRVSPWWNYFLLSPLCFMQKVQFCWHDALINVRDILVKPPVSNIIKKIQQEAVYMHDLQYLLVESEKVREVAEY